MYYILAGDVKRDVNSGRTKVKPKGIFYNLSKLINAQQNFLQSTKITIFFFDTFYLLNFKFIFLFLENGFINF